MMCLRCVVVGIGVVIRVGLRVLSLVGLMLMLVLAFLRLWVGVGRL